MSKADRFRAKQKAAGPVQANEWVPSNQRELFRAVAKALREGVLVTIGAVASDPEPQRKPEPTVTSDQKQQPKPEPEVTSDPEPGPKVTGDKKEKAAAARAKKQLEWAALYNAEGARHIWVLTPNGSRCDAVLVSTRPIKIPRYETLENMAANRATSYTTGMDYVVVIKGPTAYAKRTITHIDGRKGSRDGWQMEHASRPDKKDREAPLRRLLNKYHPDKGDTPDPVKFNEIMRELKAMKRGFR